MGGREAGGRGGGAAAEEREEGTGRGEERGGRSRRRAEEAMPRTWPAKENEQSFGFELPSTCPQAGWVSMLLLKWLQNAAQPPGSTDSLRRPARSGSSSTRRTSHRRRRSDGCGRRESLPRGTPSQVSPAHAKINTPRRYVEFGPPGAHRSLSRASSGKPSRSSAESGPGETLRFANDRKRAEKTTQSALRKRRKRQREREREKAGAITSMHRCVLGRQAELPGGVKGGEERGPRGK